MKRLVLIPSLLALATAAPLALGGPPNICHPVEIGDARSLVLEGNDVPPSGVLAERTLELLDRSDDVLVHMETLRRFWVLMNRAPKGEGAAQAKSLLQSLKGRALDAEVAATDASTRRRTLALFDVGYLVAILDTGGLKQQDTAKPYLLKALKLQPEDAAMQFGAALARFMERPKHEVNPYYRHMHAAVRLCRESDALLRKNIRVSLGHFGEELVADDWQEIERRLERKVGKAAAEV